jgi:hypothetical protein
LSTSHSSARTVTLSLRGPAFRKACSASSGTASEIGRSASNSAISSSLTLPHKPSLHSMILSPARSGVGPAVSTTGLPGLPRQVNSTLRLTRWLSDGWPACASTMLSSA